MKRKLIEVSLPLEAINREAAREKSIRHGHPSTLHMWWARRPLAAARAVLFAQMVDDPSARPDEFPSTDDQRVERERLHRLIERLATWESSRDDRLLAEARAEIANSSDGAPPAVLDPFAGGGSIPVEAQRLGLEAHAADLNPVAVLMNKALIELPPRFCNLAPIHPDAASGQIRNWRNAEGLAADVRVYGEWVRSQAYQALADLYPDAQLEDGSWASVIAWIWARTVPCPNPACGADMPLVRSWWLSRKKGRERFVLPIVVRDPTHPSGIRVEFEVGSDPANSPDASADGTIGRSGATCVACRGAVSLSHVRSEGKAGRMGKRLMAIVADGGRQRIFLAPSDHQIAAANVERPTSSPAGLQPNNPRDFKTPNYGMTSWADLFTNRQLTMLTTFADTVLRVRERVVKDGGNPAYADAVATYLGLCASKMTIFHCSLARWRADADKTAPAFGRQAVAMVWDFAEAMPFAGAGGDWRGVVDGAARTLEGLRPTKEGFAVQAPAQATSFNPEFVISTDPPYYDNIGYSDLSDFFYVWLRRVLRDVYPSLLSTMLVPKDEELVANQYRHGGNAQAKKFFEAGFRKVFARAREGASTRYPITVYYAFKQAEVDEDGEASSGWETLLEGMVAAGWEITSTWPMRTEGETRLIARRKNALASSIVLSLRPRSEQATTIDRREYLDLLRDELPLKLRELQEGAIAPVDLAQAAIGPGMAVFSRYARVVEPSGAPLTVREALRLINGVLGEVLSDQEGDFDADTRWCLKWFETHGFERASYGEAETLAGAFNTSVSKLDRSGAVAAKGGEVRLLTTSELHKTYRPDRDEHIILWEVAVHLVKALDESGLAEAGRILNGASSRLDVEAVKELAYLVFSMAEKRSMVQVAGMFNVLVTSWPEVTAAAKAHASTTEQTMLALEDELDD